MRHAPDCGLLWLAPALSCAAWARCLPTQPALPAPPPAYPCLATRPKVCRNAERGREAVERVRSESGNPDVHLKVGGAGGRVWAWAGARCLPQLVPDCRRP